MEDNPNKPSGRVNRIGVKRRGTKKPSYRSGVRLLHIPPKLKGYLGELQGRCANTLAAWTYWVKWFHGGEVTELRIVRKGAGWLAIVKATYKGKDLVAFENGNTLESALLRVGDAAGHSSFRWTRDKPWNKRST